MRRRLASLAFGSSIVGAIVVGLALGTSGCESDDYVLFFGDPDAGRDALIAADAVATVDGATDGSTGGDGATDGSTDAGGDGGDASVSDAGSDGAADSGAGPTITCGATTCSAGTQVCCIALDGTESCAAAGLAACGAGVERRCDDRSDCAPNELCCATLGALYVGGTCQTACGARQLCKATAECANAAQTCDTETCRGKQVSTCGGLPPGQCN